MAKVRIKCAVQPGGHAKRAKRKLYPSAISRAEQDRQGRHPGVISKRACCTAGSENQLVQKASAVAIMTDSPLRVTVKRVGEPVQQRWAQ